MGRDSARCEGVTIHEGRQPCKTVTNPFFSADGSTGCVVVVPVWARLERGQEFRNTLRIPMLWRATAYIQTSASTLRPCQYTLETAPACRPERNHLRGRCPRRYDERPTVSQGDALSLGEGRDGGEGGQRLRARRCRRVRLSVHTWRDGSAVARGIAIRSGDYRE